MTFTSFGQVIQPTGLNNGFPGTVSRTGERVIHAREFVQQSASGTYNLNFGDPAVIVQNNSGGYYDSVLDFVTAAASNISLLTTQFAGIAVRNVQTQLTYPAGQTPGILQVGYYASGTMAEVLERGSATVTVLVSNSPVAGSQLYTRVVLNAAITAGLVGDWEVGIPAASDQFSVEATTQTQGSPNVTISSGTNTQNNQLVSGVGIPAGTYVVSGGGTTAIVLSANATLTSAANILQFSNLFAVPRCVAMTGNLDANNVLEITLKERNAA